CSSVSSFFFALSGVHLHLPSFPTRRSSDLSRAFSAACWLLKQAWAKKRSCDASSANRRSFSACASQRCPSARGSGLIDDLCLARSEEHTSELQSRVELVCRLLLEKKKRKQRRGSGQARPPAAHVDRGAGAASDPTAGDRRDQRPRRRGGACETARGRTRLPAAGGR